jgi:hypothetical protein
MAPRAVDAHKAAARRSQGRRRTSDVNRWQPRTVCKEQALVTVNDMAFSRGAGVAGAVQ